MNKAETTKNIASSKQAWAPVDLETVLKDELELIKSKRKQCKSEDGVENLSNLFGIALSGGGIRSATINLGILEILNKCGILSKVDYLSTVSGGGYIGGYIHAKLRSSGFKKDAYNNLFLNDIPHFEKYKNYLIPENKLFNKFRLYGSFVFSVLMNWLWIIFLFLTLYYSLQTIFNYIPLNMWTGFGYIILISAIITFFIHYFLHDLVYLRSWTFSNIYALEGLIFISAVVFGLHVATSLPQFSIFNWGAWQCFIITSCVLIITGAFANPNVITLHNFYKESLASAFLNIEDKNPVLLKLYDLIQFDPKPKTCFPYPLINSCLNLLGAKNNKETKQEKKNHQDFVGTMASDYFLLSPLYCGSKLTNYIQTSSPHYNDFTLSTAIAVSGAAVNPNMGTRTNRVLAFFMTLFNLRLGYWALNPEAKIFPFFNGVSWWPYYHVLELLCQTTTRRRRISISDGGHIENLGIYELLRRRCRLIIAIDASADPEYNFSDLKNLVIRARQELGLIIDFRQPPEMFIKPLPSIGFSKSHFVVANIKEMTGKSHEDGKEYKGLLVYIKSSLRPQEKFKGGQQSKSFYYKIHHPTFPHESTIDQFFSKEQWEAYYNLGKFIAGDLLKIDIRKKEDFQNFPVKTINGLFDIFDSIITEEDLLNHYNFYKSCS